MHPLADAVADELPHDGTPVRLDVLLHGVADVRNPVAGPRAPNGLVERFLGHPQQLRCVFRHLPDRQRDRAVAEVPVERRADVDRDDVAFLQHPPA